MTKSQLLSVYLFVCPLLGRLDWNVESYSSTSKMLYIFLFVVFIKKVNKFNKTLLKI